MVLHPLREGRSRPLSAGKPSEGRHTGGGRQRLLWSDDDPFTWESCGLLHARAVVLKLYLTCYAKGEAPAVITGLPSEGPYGRRTTTAFLDFLSRASLLSLSELCSTCDTCTL